MFLFTSHSGLYLELVLFLLVSLINLHRVSAGNRRSEAGLRRVWACCACDAAGVGSEAYLYSESAFTAAMSSCLVSSGLRSAS